MRFKKKKMIKMEGLKRRPKICINRASQGERKTGRRKNGGGGTKGRRKGTLGVKGKKEVSERRGGRRGKGEYANK